MYTYRGSIAKLFMKLCGLLPLQEKVVFSSFDGKIYGDNPQVIYEDMKKRYPNIKYIWMMRNPRYSIPGAVVVKPHTFKAIYHFATARLWISNSRLRLWMVKRKKQFYVQTWHGDACLKKIEKDAAIVLGKDYVEEAIHDSQIADLMISGSKFRTQNYRDAFWYDGEILELGMPKTDVFYMDSLEIKKKVRDYFKVAPNVKIALYVPTFRADDNMDCYNIDYKRLLTVMQSKYGDKWIVIVRLHPKIATKQNFIEYNEDIVNGTPFNPTNELIIGSDLVITDYSACMFAGLESNTPVILYASDIDEYMDDRGTYFNFDELPFPLAENNDELEKCIIEFDEMEYKEKADAFKNRIGYFNGPNSTEKVVDNIMKRINWRKIK